MRVRNISLTEGVIWKQILVFALPLLLINLMQQLYSVADLIIVGNFSGVDAMAGVGATASIINMVIGLAIGLATGIAVVRLLASMAVLYVINVNHNRERDRRGL